MVKFNYRDLFRSLIENLGIPDESDNPERVFLVTENPSFGEWAERDWQDNPPKEMVARFVSLEEFCDLVKANPKEFGQTKKSCGLYLENFLASARNWGKGAQIVFNTPCYAAVRELVKKTPEELGIGLFQTS